MGRQVVRAEHRPPRPQLDRFWMWSMDLCAITVVELRAGRPVLRAHNLTAHLEALSDAETVAELDERESTGAL